MPLGSPAATRKHHKEPPVPAALQGPQHLPPMKPLEHEPGLWQSPPITGLLEGAQPPHLLHKCLHQHLGSSFAKAHCNRTTPALSHVGKILLESCWWPCKPHCQSTRHHLLLTPALYRHSLAESSPRHTQAGSRGSKSPGVPRAGLALPPLPVLLICRHRNQAVSLVLQLLNPQPLHQQRCFVRAA